MSLQPGQMLAYFRLGETIGQGGMGSSTRPKTAVSSPGSPVKILTFEMASDTERLRSRRVTLE